ncbi:helix-turn-helix transcriptional regulator [Paenibacillus tritici]|uniref:Helix-turn-helix transcriptional regulator n=1 Tax=Paenibacillus tritici TaxID=1873425 RepID=A0ABX2DU41_9BACL|nr:helix-turn-helix transcriptional regulator [Paenibacillus tritici]
MIHPEGMTIDRPEGSGDYVFVFFRSRMELRIQALTLLAEPNTFIIYNRTSPYSYKDAEAPLVHDWFHFELEAADEFFGRLKLPLDTLMKARDPLYISRKVNELHWENLQNGTFRHEIIDSIIRCLFMKLSDIRHHVESRQQISKYYDDFLNMRNEVLSSPSTWYSVEDLAERMNMSKSYFQQIYKQFFGLPVVNDIIRNRLGYASYLLKNTTHSISQIAATCGYENDVHFMRQFKRFAGQTPSEYRGRPQSEPKSGYPGTL